MNEYSLAKVQLYRIKNLTKLIEYPKIRNK